jgi:uncharacterized YigZ family protein
MLTLSAPAEWAQEIKKSRFLARAAPAATVASAQQFIDTSADADARHNCWAYRIGTEYRWNDADEPAGTAGRPILAAIDGQQLDCVVVLVTRWFGGIKLGAGGLMRAYGGTAAECLRRAPKQELIAQRILVFELGFEWLGAMYAAIEQFGATKLDESFDSNGAQLRVQVAINRADALCEMLQDATRGAVTVLALD